MSFFFVPDVNLNQKIIELLISEDYQSRLPQVGGEEVQVFISHVSDSGDIFVQKESNTFTLIEKMIAESSDKVLKAGPSGIIGPNQLFLARFAEDNNLYRAELLSDEKQESGKFAVFFVDFGNCSLVEPQEIYDIRHVSGLGDMPRQALKCRLAGVPPEGCTWSPAATRALRELVPENQQVRLKVVGGGDEGSVPLVELHLNNTTDGSINFDLSTEFDIFPPLPADKSTNNGGGSAAASVVASAASSPSRTRIEPGSGSTSTVASTNGHSSAAAMSTKLVGEVGAVTKSMSQLSADLASMQPLAPPSIPGEGEHFDVNVTFAVSPSSFVVQPFNELDKLDALMADMNTFYGHEANLKELCVEDLTEGEYFAGEQEMVKRIAGPKAISMSIGVSSTGGTR
jgi:hypothetical protein